MHRNNIEDQDQVVVVFIRYTKIRSLTANDLCKFSHEQKKRRVRGGREQLQLK